MKVYYIYTSLSNRGARKSMDLKFLEGLFALANVNKIPREDLIRAYRPGCIKCRVDPCVSHGSHPGLETELLAPAVKSGACLPCLMDSGGYPPAAPRHDSFNIAHLERMKIIFHNSRSDILS